MDELTAALRAIIRDEVARQFADLEQQQQQPEPTPPPQPTHAGDDVLTVREAARYTKRHPATISEACRAGELRGVQRKKGASWRIRREDLDVWMGAKPVVRRGPLRAL